MNHSEHYPTMIEHPRSKKRVAVKSPYEHDKQLLAWKLPGLDPKPDPPADVLERMQPPTEPGYPMMIEHEKSGQRVRVDSKAEHELRLAEWAGKKTTATTTRPPAKPATPPPPPPPTKAAGKGKGETRLQPPSVEDYLKKNYPKGIAQRMADEEVRKYNAGEAPYDKA